MLKVNWPKATYLSTEIEVNILPVSMELDEQWSFVKNKSNQRWLWLALNHHTSEVLAYTFGSRSNLVFNRFKNLLRPFNVKKYFTDGLGAYTRGLPAEIRGYQSFFQKKYHR